MKEKLKLSQNAVRILNKVKEHILEEPARANIYIWKMHKNNESDENFRQRVVHGSYKNHARVPECGTVGCIAGWIHQLNLTDENRNLWPGDAAYRLLGLTYYETYGLFHSPYWPEENRIELGKTTAGTIEHVQAIVNRIDAFISDCEIVP